MIENNKFNLPTYHFKYLRYNNRNYIPISEIVNLIKQTDLHLIEEPGELKTVQYALQNLANYFKDMDRQFEGEYILNNEI